MTEEALSSVRVASSSAAASSSSEAVSGRVFDQQTSPSNQQPQANKLIGSMLRQLLHLLGMDHEHQLLQRLILSRPAMASEGTSGEMSTSQGFQQLRSAEGTASANQQAPQLAADTVKSLLLKTVSNEQLPLPIREAAQQVAQAITGQQLLLAADRSAQMSYVTLFVPFMNEHGEQMAGVHIQTRKDKRGNLDSDNCHLFFDLQMKTLGNIMIDVQVVDRIVSLKIHHDHPQMQALIEEGRQSMMEALEAMGYRLSLIKAVPLPEQAHIVSSESAEQPVTETGLLNQMAQGMKYKGVDVRV